MTRFNVPHSYGKQHTVPYHSIPSPRPPFAPFPACRTTCLSPPLRTAGRQPSLPAFCFWPSPCISTSQELPPLLLLFPFTMSSEVTRGGAWPPTSSPGLPACASRSATPSVSPAQHTRSLQALHVLSSSIFRSLSLYLRVRAGAELELELPWCTTYYSKKRFQAIIYYISMVYGLKHR
jgi:hypothetical protein